MIICLATALSALYSTLDPSSISQHFAFYELYPETTEGRESLKHAWELLSGGCTDCVSELKLPVLDPKPFIAFINRAQSEGPPLLDEASLVIIERLARHLGNRRLKGFGLWEEKKLFDIADGEIDLARGLLVADLGNTPEARQKVRSYEAHIDLMALQIAARLKVDATALEKIRAINDYIFSEMRFRFPPHSLYAKEIDIYTFLPSVLDSRRGVCLGVSILYLSLAQRLNLQLEAITPPGHIYVRYVDPVTQKETNIETTARGIDIPSKMYLNLETKKLQKRTLKEVIGWAFMNQAAMCWHHEDSATAVTLYERARPYLGDDYLLNMFLGLNYLFVGKLDEGKALLKKVKDFEPDHQIGKDTVAEDYLSGKTDVKALQAVFSEVNEKRESILEKQKKLQEVVTKWPQFRQGVFHLATTWLQLGRKKEAIPLLEQYVALAPEDATANYYLAAIYHERRHFNQAWKYLRLSEKLVHAKGHDPQALKELRRELEAASPE